MHEGIARSDFALRHSAQHAGFRPEAVLVATRGHDGQPLAIVAVTGLGEIPSHGRHRYRGRIASRIGRKLFVFVAGSKDDHTAFHRRVCTLLSRGITARHLDEIVDGFFEQLGHFRDTGCRGISPRVLADDGSVVGGIFDGSSGISLFGLLSEDLATHQAHTAISRAVATGHTGHTFSVVVACTDRAGHVGAVSFVIGFDFAPDHVFGFHKVIAIDIVDKSVAVVIDIGLSVLFLFVDVEIVHQVFVSSVNTAIDNGHNDRLLAGSVLLPHGFDVAVGSFDGTCIDRAVIIIVPLLGQKGVVKTAGSRLSGCTACRCIGIGLYHRCGAHHGEDALCTLYALHLVELLQHRCHIFTLVEIEGVPAVETFGHRSGFIDACGLEDSFHLVGRSILQGRGHGRGHTLHLYVAAAGGGYRLLSARCELQMNAAFHGKNILVKAHRACVGVSGFHLQVVLTRCCEHQAGEDTRR